MSKNTEYIKLDKRIKYLEARMSLIEEKYDNLITIKNKSLIPDLNKLESRLSAVEEELQEIRAERINQSLKDAIDARNKPVPECRCDCYNCQLQSHPLCKNHCRIIDMTAHNNPQPEKERHTPSGRSSVPEHEHQSGAPYPLILNVCTGCKALHIDGKGWYIPEPEESEE